MDASSRERCQKALEELDMQAVILTNAASSWKSLEAFFADVNSSLWGKMEDLAKRQAAIEDLDKETTEALDERERSILAREEAAFARLEKIRALSLAGIAQQKRKWLQENGEIPTETPSPEGEEEAEKAEEVLAVPSEGEPAMVSSVGDKTKAAEDNPTQQEKYDNDTTRDDTCDNDAHDNDNRDNDNDNDGDSDDGEGDGDTNGNNSGPKSGPPVPCVKARPDLIYFAQVTDGDGLARYLAKRRRDIHTLRQELPLAFQCAVDPTRLVLKALAGYAATFDVPYRRSCLVLLEILWQVLADPGLGYSHSVVIKESAKELAQLWRSSDTVHCSAEYSTAMDAQAFLQLLATFNIASDYDKDELCKLVLCINNRRRMPSLCRYLGLADKMPELANKLAKAGRNIDALGVAYAFGFIDNIRPVELLKAHLRDSKKPSGRTLRKSKSHSAGLSDAIAKELTAVRIVVRAIGDFKLESKYPDLESLKKLIPELEKKKLEKKRAAAAAREHPNSHHANKKRRSGGGPPYPTHASIINAGVERRLTQTFDRAVYAAASNMPTYPSAAQTVQAYNNNTSYVADPNSANSSYMYTTYNTSSSYPTNAVYGNSSASYGNQQQFVPNPPAPSAQPTSAYQPYPQ